MKSKASGRWVRRGSVIVLDDARPIGPAVDSEFGFPFSFPSFPAKPAGASASTAGLPVPLFPFKPSDPLVTDPKMASALMSAVHSLERLRGLKPDTLPVRFTIAEITNPSGTFPSAGYLDTVTDYIASEAKVSVMYAAYALRDMVRRFAGVTGANTANLFARLAQQMNPTIARTIRTILAETFLVPSYKEVFALTPINFAQRVSVNFSRAYDKALEGMIVPSENSDAAASVHGIGYGYLNGALAAGGFPSLWVGGDFLGGKKWPYTRVASRNDAFVAQAGSTSDMARLVSLMMTNRILDSWSCNEMRGRLARSAANPSTTSFVFRTGIFKSKTITHNKIGYGLLKTGQKVWSEVSVYDSPVNQGRRYVVAWQNLVSNLPFHWTEVASVIKATITEFEK